MECLNLSKLIAYQNQLLNDKEEHNIQQHLSGCVKCTKQVAVYQTFGKFLKRTLPFENQADATECYDEFEIVSFIESRSARKTNSKFYLHLTHCQSCMDMFLALENLLVELKTEGLIPTQTDIKEKVNRFITSIVQTAKNILKSIRDMLVLPVPVYRRVGIIIIIFSAIIFFLPEQNQNNIRFTTREPEQNRFEGSIQLLYPIDHISMNEGSPEFRWEEVTEATKYNILLLDANGDIIWEKQTSLSKFRLPREIKLLPSMMYFWQVEAFFEDGSSIVSGMSGFRFSK